MPKINRPSEKRVLAKGPNSLVAEYFSYPGAPYLRPAWGCTIKGHDYLMVWCDECLRWNQHGLVDDERTHGYLTARVPHCGCADLSACGLMMCMGMSDADLSKLLKRYWHNGKAKHTPPPIRRVYPIPEKNCELCFTPHNLVLCSDPAQQYWVCVPCLAREFRQDHPVWVGDPVAAE